MLTGVAQSSEPDSHDDTSPHPQSPHESASTAAVTVPYQQGSQLRFFPPVPSTNQVHGAPARSTASPPASVISFQHSPSLQDSSAGEATQGPDIQNAQPREAWGQHVEASTAPGPQATANEQQGAFFMLLVSVLCYNVASSPATLPTWHLIGCC